MLVARNLCGAIPIVPAAGSIPTVQAAGGRHRESITHKELKQGFTQHERQTRQHARWLERVCKYLGVKPRDKKCAGIEGVLNEASNEFNGSLQLYVQTASLACNGQWLFLVCC